MFRRPEAPGRARRVRGSSRWAARGAFVSPIYLYLYYTHIQVHTHIYVHIYTYISVSGDRKREGVRDQLGAAAVGKPQVILCPLYISIYIFTRI